VLDCGRVSATSVALLTITDCAGFTESAAARRPSVANGGGVANKMSAAIGGVTGTFNHYTQS